MESKTYHKAIAMAESEQADRFQNPLRTFPKKVKLHTVVDDEALRKQKLYNDKSASEHDKALSSLGHLFSYYKDRCHESEYEHPSVRRRVAISVKLEK